MPKAKKRGRPRIKQEAGAGRQRSPSVHEAPLENFEKRIRRGPSHSELSPMKGGGDIINLAPDSKTYANGKRVRSTEPQELRGYPEPVATVTAEDFKDMDRDLQSTFRGVFHSLHNALGSANTPGNPNPPHHRRNTRSSAQVSDQFFKSLVPKDKVPEKEEHIKVQFTGTNTIKTDAPGYTETITFGNGRWSRTRNGVSETGRLSDEEEARISEHMRHTIDGIMRHTAEGLAGMMGPNDNMFGRTGYFNSALPLSPNGIATPRPSEVSISPKGRGRGRGKLPRGVFRGRGGFNPNDNFGPDVFDAGRGGSEMFGKGKATSDISEASGNFGSLGDTRKLAENTFGKDGGDVFGSSRDLLSCPVVGVYGSTSESQDDAVATRISVTARSKKRTRITAGDMFERIERGGFSS